MLRPGGVLYLSTAPDLSLAGAHLPRLLVPVPVHILLGRRRAFALFRCLARHAPWLLQEPKEANTFIALAEQGKEKQDDVLQQVTVRAPRRLDPRLRLPAPPRGPPRDRLLPARPARARCGGAWSARRGRRT